MSGATPSDAPVGTPPDRADPLTIDLHREANALLRYVIGAPGGETLAVRYMQAVRAGPHPQPLGLPLWALAWPPALRLLEPLGGARSERGQRLVRRLRIAGRVGDSDPATTSRFHNYGRRGRVPALAAVLGHGILEVLLLPLRSVLRW